MLASGHVNISPRFPLHLAGYGLDRMSAGAVGEPLEANALLLQCKQGRVLFVQVDVISAGNALRRHLLDHFGARLQDEELFLVASHTHFAPNIDANLPGIGQVDPAYVDQVFEQITGLVDRVLRALPEPVHLEYGEGRANHSVNRRHWCFSPMLRFPPVKRVMARHPNPRGLRDETVRVWSASPSGSGPAPLAVLWNYACHPVTTWPFNAISADYPGAVRRSIRTRFGGNVSVVFLPGFAGDVRPNRIDRLPLSPYRLLHRIVNGPIFGEFQAKSSRRWVSSLADLVVATLSAKLYAVPVARISGRRISLSMGEVMEGEVDSRPLSFQLVRIDDSFAILGISAEPVAEYAVGLDDLLSPGTFVPVGYIDGVCAYLPTTEMLSEGGMEVTSPGYGLEHANYRLHVSNIVRTAVQALSPAVRSGK